METPRERAASMVGFTLACIGIATAVIATVALGIWAAVDGRRHESLVWVTGGGLVVAAIGCLIAAVPAARIALRSRLRP